jgi:hypothetical protein
MAFLTPLFLLLALLAVPIILLYMLRLRRREMSVSSTMLWQQLLRDREANAPWQKLRRNLLLILQLLILAALVLALARPYIPVPSIVSGSVVVLLDASASMQASDVEPSRFETAIVRVEEIINTLGGGDQMSIIQVGVTPAVLIAASSDRNALRQALDEASVSQGAADWHAAIALAAGAAQGFTDARIAIVSDGGLPSDLPPLAAEVVYVPVGSSSENLGIAALATRDVDNSPQLFASVRNYGGQDQQAVISLTLDGNLYDSRRVNVGAGRTANLTWALPPESSHIQASLSEMSSDFLAADNLAFAVHEGGIQNRSLLVTEGNLFLEQIFGVLPGIDPFKAGPDTVLTGPDAEPFDLYIFDSVALPDPMPDADILIVNPPADTTGLISVTGVFSRTNAIRVADSPILQFVEWSNVNIFQAKRVLAPWMQTLVEGQDGPLILAGERTGNRYAVISFDLLESDLPLQIAFPVLMANLTDWLSPGRAFAGEGQRHPGDPVALTPGASATQVIVTNPAGVEERIDASGESLTYAGTDQPGIYQVSIQDAAGARPGGAFAVNLFSEAESDILPALELNLGSQVEDIGEAGEDVGQWEFWPWLAGIALLILALEWWVHHRGTRLPHISIR